MKNKIIHRFIIGVFVSLYVLVATTSMINSVAFFDLSHNIVMSWTLAIGFELGAAASLAAILILDKTNKFMVWSLFVTLTLFQMMSNTFHAYVNLENYIPWIELFGLIEEEPMMQKRILSIVSGAILPLVALGFIKSLTDYLKPDKEEVKEETVEDTYDSYYKERNDLLAEMTKKNEEKFKEKKIVTPKEVKENIEKKEKEILVKPKKTAAENRPIQKKIQYKP